MKLTVLYTISCCWASREFTTDYQALSFARKHLRNYHPARYRKLERAARRAATSRNGCGYYDAGEKRGSGWHNAGANFRNGWMERCLRYDIEQRGV